MSDFENEAMDLSGNGDQAMGPLIVFEIPGFSVPRQWTTFENRAFGIGQVEIGHF